MSRFWPRGILALSRAALDVEYAPTARAPSLFREVGAFAVVDVRGPLLHRCDGHFDGYDAILERVDAALASARPILLLSVDSPGGEASGCVELAHDIRTRAAARGKRVLTYVDGCACSAGYIVACAASTIYLPPSATVGSVGVIKVAVDMTGADRALGLSYGVFVSGDRKADGFPNIPLADAARAAFQGEVDAMAGVLFDHVGRARGLSPAKVQGQQGAWYVGAAGVAAGLADGVMSFDDLVAAGIPPATRAPTPKASIAPAPAPARPSAEDRQRASLLATRPDFVPEVIAYLQTQPLDVVRAAVKTIPNPGALVGEAQHRTSTPARTNTMSKKYDDAVNALMSAASDPQATPTERSQAKKILESFKSRGGEDGEKARAALDRVDWRRTMAAKSGVPWRGGVEDSGTRQVFGVMTPEQARAERRGTGR